MMIPKKRLISGMEVPVSTMADVAEASDGGDGDFHVTVFPGVVFWGEATHV
jgi:hypothetical protein